MNAPPCAPDQRRSRNATIASRVNVRRCSSGPSTGRPSGSVTLSDALYTATKIGAATLAPFDLDLSGGGVSISDALFAKSLVASPPRLALCP